MQEEQNKQADVSQEVGLQSTLLTGDELRRVGLRVEMGEPRGHGGNVIKLSKNLAF